MDFPSRLKGFESDPPFFMLDESDDEETIAEEELLEPEIDPKHELLILASDLDVTLEELITQSGNRRSRRTRKKVDYQAMLIEEQLKKKDQNVVLREPKSLVEMCSKVVQEMSAGPSNSAGTSTSVSELTKFYLINTLMNNEDEEGDADYKPMLRHIFNREIRTGPRYQAEVPEGTSVYNSVEESAQCSDKLMWRPPSGPSEVEVDTYMYRVNSFVQELCPLKLTCNRPKHRDNEQALEILLHCNFNEELALDIFMKKWRQRLLNRANVHHSTENIENEENKSKENIENEKNTSREINDNEVNNDLPSPPKIPKN